MQLDSAEAVLALDSSRVRWPMYKSIGMIGAHPAGGECDYEVRMLAPSSGMSEDPITGSLNSALAHWLQAQGRLEQSITVAQGVPASTDMGVLSSRLSIHTGSRLVGRLTF